MTENRPSRSLRTAIVCVLALVTMGHAETSVAADPAITLTRDGTTPYTITVAGDAIPAEKTAAEQLQKYLRQVTDVTFEIKSEDEVAADARQILIGAGARVRSLLPEQDWEALGHDGIVLKTVGGNLILAGGRPRGSLYAVFEFLEDAVGCRFWTSTESDIPNKPTLEIESLDVVYVPPFKLRAHSTYDINENPEFATILRQYGTYLKQDEAWGGRSIQIRCAFRDLLPVKKYFKDHPEWYTDAENGDLPCTSESTMPVSPRDWQMVTTNEEALDEAARQAIERIRKQPDADSIALWLNDNPHYATDPKSLAIIEKHGGKPSALMLKYVNDMAERIHKVYPDIAIEYQAYYWAVDVPENMKPAPGVIVEVAPIGADFGHPFDSKWNARSRDQMLEWSSIAPMLNTYYYATNFRWSWFPHPNWFTFGPDFKFWADHGVVGLYDQAGTQTGSKAGDLLELRSWLLAKLMWDPHQDEDKLMDEFLNGYYGAAGPYIKQYIRLVQDSFDAQERYLGTYNAGFTFMSLEVVNQSHELFNQAREAVKDNPIFVDRLRSARLSLDTVSLAKFNYFHHEAQATGQSFKGPQNLEEAFEELEATARHFGITGFSEGPVSLEEGLAQMKRRLVARPANPLPEFAQGYGPYQVVDYPPDDIHLYMGVPGKLIEDPQAPLGEAAMVAADNGIESVQVRIGPYLPYHKNWHVYVYARVDTTPDSDLQGDGLGGVIIDLDHRGATGHKTFPLKELAGESYQLFDMGVHDLDGGKEIRFHPMDRPDVTKVYIGRVILIQEGAQKSE